MTDREPLSVQGKPLIPPRPFEAVFPQLLTLLLRQGKVKEAWALEFRREERIAWEIEMMSRCPSRGSSA